MSKGLIAFEGQEVMVLGKTDVKFDFKGDFLIRAKDVATVLEYAQTKDFVAIVKDKYQVKVKNSDFAKPENRKLNNAGEIFITSFGMNQGLANSTMPKAEPFQDWLYEDVLPSIQHTGQYAIAQKPDSYMIDDPIDRAKRWIEEFEEKKELVQKILLDAPKVTVYDNIVDSTNLLSMNQAAKTIGIGRNTLFSYLRDNEILMKDNLPYETYKSRGYFEVKDVPIRKGDGYVNQPTTRVTSKGLIWLTKLVKSIPDNSLTLSPYIN